jgi:membrane protein CcdC involved in cytochrome C biogenesis
MHIIKPRVSMSNQDLDTRLNFLIKIIGIAFLAIGLFVEFMVATTSLYPALAGMFQMLAIVMIVVGAISVIAKIT